MPRVSTDQLAARRQHILDGARRCFAAHGYEGATVRRLEQSTGLSRGAIFHYFRDKDALFLALAEQDARRMADVVAEQGLVQVMRNLLDGTRADARDHDGVAATGPAPDPDGDLSWLGTRLEVSRRLRTDPDFRERWQAHSAELTAATRERLERQAAAGALRDDVPVPVLAQYLELVLEGLVSHLAMGLPADALDGVLDLVEQSVRTLRG
ncbi:TetR/AcrR family transcriptional regulator [Pseudonocardia sp. RS11V-5]|uniref:TetR/AcrR family transcriptional regulator n=1 Tax=Pseudonocardia terrae TaxID=2905831 RepID=UPI001E2CB0AB|nr:TetR/AcrR family transcriptional regulator [Pseudonocardia terrae]MCE3550027.1 TetR/AcrR family transcriptional regulator [Pseudonocardia terrae]